MHGPLLLTTTHTLKGKVREQLEEPQRRYITRMINVLKQLKSGTCKGNDFLGWLTLPSDITEELITDIEETASSLSDISDVVVVIGIGGSYLGARAVIESQKSTFGHSNTEILYAGNQMSPGYLTELAEYLVDKKWSIVVISKSGTTTEPAIAFRFLKGKLVAQFGDSQAVKRIVAITDASKGALHTLAKNEGLKTFVIPDNVGGRFSVLTPVGLLPIAIAGFNIREFVAGALIAQSTFLNESTDNLAVRYAALRNTLYQNGFGVEIMVNYHHKFHFITEWWKQLFGESEGKDGKGIFPAGVSFSTDLHSMGQYIQDGKRMLFETVVKVKNSSLFDEVISHDNQDLDNLNYLEGRTISYVNNQALEGTAIAHHQGGVPNIVLELEDLTIQTVGELLYFYELSCAISGIMLDVNPFNQPGVEDYKRNMFALLEKPGYENLKNSSRLRVLYRSV